MVGVLATVLNNEVDNNATSEAAHTAAGVGLAAIALVGEVLANQTAPVAPPQSVALFVHAVAAFAESERAFSALFDGADDNSGGGGDDDEDGDYDELAAIDDVLRDACAAAEEGASGFPDGVVTVFVEQGMVLHCSSHEVAAQVPVAVQASSATLV